jgi:PhoH-like ATPase
MRKTYVLDTNVLLSDPKSINSFDDNDVIIPLAVVEELDKHKTRQDEIGGTARGVSRKLDELRALGSLHDGVPMSNGGTLRIAPISKKQIEQLPGDLDLNKVDNQIIAFMLSLDENATLVSRDINIRIKCDALGIPCQDYLKIRVTEADNFYTGVKVVETDASVVSTFFSEGLLENLDEVFPNEKFFPNQVVVLKSTSSGKSIKSALGKFVKGSITPIRTIENAAGFRYRNKEQQFALDLLFDDSIKLVTLVSKAGTGKTSLALAAGLEQLIGYGSSSDAKYSKLIVTRPVMPLGKDIGFLPGTIEEKMAPWVAPIKDALNFLLEDKKQKPKAGRKADTDFSSNVYIQMMQEKGLIEVEALAYIRGRSIPNTYIIIDEAQNLSRAEIKTILTRVGEGSKVVLTGDIQQIDNTHVDAFSNGLTYAVEKFKEYDIAAHITLIKGERSSLATIASEIL